MGNYRRKGGMNIGGFMKEKIANDILKSGTGFMQTLTEAIRKMEDFDYKEEKFNDLVNKSKK